MAIVASGEISLGGNATATRSVACELFRSGTAAICMDESAVRTLAARTTAASAICMNNFYGKANVPTALGQSFGGGYYTGVSYASCTGYFLYVAPNATGCACCQWKTTNDLTNNSSNATCNDNNGYWNTFTYLNNASHPAGNWTATLSLGGFSDWYLPARHELNVLYKNKGSMPTGEGYPSANYWSSTEDPAATGSTACRSYFGWGYFYNSDKNLSMRVRAIRKSSFTPSAPTAFGQCFGGGFYQGIVYASCCHYYLVVAPNATGCACCQWKTTNDLTNNCSNSACNLPNGYWNTFTYLNNSNHPAGNWTATRNIGGFTDWYLPARDEWGSILANRGSFPTFEGIGSSCVVYWSSTEFDSTRACCVYNLGAPTAAFGQAYKASACRATRAVRRCSFTPSAPTTLGQYIHGGIYAGTISSPANYYLIVAPNLTGCISSCCWKSTNDLTNNCSNATCNDNNGYWNTFTYLNNSSHGAGNWAATRAIGGFTDWYLPALNELNVAYTNKASMPSCEGFDNATYWTSSESTTGAGASAAFGLGLGNGSTYNSIKNTNFRLRAVRRVAF